MSPKKAPRNHKQFLSMWQDREQNFKNEYIFYTPQSYIWERDYGEISIYNNLKENKIPEIHQIKDVQTSTIKK